MRMSSKKEIARVYCSTANDCACNSKGTPYRIGMISVEDKPVKVCDYVTFDMRELVRRTLGDGVVCSFQSERLFPVYSDDLITRLKRLLKSVGNRTMEPVPKYLCLKSKVYRVRRGSDGVRA